MSDSDQPRRISSELTLVLDVEKALSERALAAVKQAAKSYPELPCTDDLSPEERSALLHMHREKQDETETLERCPAGCRVTLPSPACPCCSGDGMVSASRAAKWKAGNP